MLFCDILHPLYGLLNEFFERELASSSSLDLGTQIIIQMINLKEGTSEVFIKLIHSEVVPCFLPQDHGHYN